MPYRIGGDPQRALLELSKAMKQAGAGDLRKEFHKSVRTAARPVLPKIRNSARARFPSKGGLNVHMARGTRYRAVVKTGAKTAGVSIRANKTDPRTDTRGRIWHPIPRLGSTRVQATHVKTRKVKTTYEGGETQRDDKGRKLGAVQYFPEAVGYFRDPIEGSAEEIRDDLVKQLRAWSKREFGD